MRQSGVKVISKTRPDTNRYWARGLGVLAVMMSGAALSGCMSGLDLFSDSKVDTTVRTATVQNGNTERLTDEITVRNTASLDNNWIGLDMTLVNKATGAAWPAARELAYYYGRDGG